MKDIIDNIKEDLRAFTGKSLENAMRNLPKKPKNAQPRDGLRKAELDEFLKDVQIYCPTKI